MSNKRASRGEVDPTNSGRTIKFPKYTVSSESPKYVGTSAYIVLDYIIVMQTISKLHITFEGDELHDSKKSDRCMPVRF